MNTPGTQRRDGQGPAAGRPNNVVSLNELKRARARRLYRSGMDGYTGTLHRLEAMVADFEGELGSCRALLSRHIEACQISLDIHAACNDALERGDLGEVIRLRDRLLNEGAGKAAADGA